jgi:hypothetical protein
MTDKKNIPAKIGAPTKYREDFPRMAYVSCADAGTTNLMLARLFGVSKDTICQWQREYPGFSDSLKKGRDEYDTAVVEKNLLKRANGYKTIEVTKEFDESGNLKAIKNVHKSVAPDVTAQIFWLKNRHPDRWRDTRHLGGSVDIRITHEEALEALG